MNKLFSYIKKYKLHISISAVCHVFTALFTVVSIPLIIPFFQILFEREVPVLTHPDSAFNIAGWIKYYGAELLNNYDKSDALIMVCGFIVLVFFLKNLFRYLAAYFIIPMRNGVVRDIRSNLYQSYLQLPASFHDEHRKGDLLSRVNADSIEIEWSILSFLEVMFKSPLIIIGSLAFMLYVSPQLSIFVFVLLLFTIGIIGFVSRRLKQDSGEVQSRIGKLSGQVEQSLSGLETIKAYQAEKYMTANFEEENSRIYSVINRLLRRRDLSSPLSEFLGVSIVAVLLAYGSSLVFNGSLTPETFFAFIFAFYQVIEPAKSFSTAYYNVQKGTAAVDRVQEITERAARIDSSEETKSFPKSWKQLAFSKLSFQYASTQAAALKDVSFKIDKGDKLAVIGSSGSGKSTLLKILLRQYPTTDGEISIGDTTIDQIKLADYRSRLGVVSQQAILFNDSIQNNILMGRALDHKRLDLVIDQALLEPVLSRFKNGILHQVGDSGTLLSGGEKQRITIARALYGDPEILLFDEPTSALDAASEKLVTDAIGLAIKDRTAILVAHRLSTIKLANKVLVVEDGKVDQFGEMSSLSNQKGKFNSYLKAYQLG